MLMIKIFLTQFTIYLLGIIAFGCSINHKSKNVDNWIGHYGYSEEPVQALAGYNMVMIWDLSITKKNDSCQGILEVNGQQTFFKLLADISGDSSSIAIVYNRMLDGVPGNWKRGDTLFTLSKGSKGLNTKWFLLEPRLLEKVPRECNCFSRD